MLDKIELSGDEAVGAKIVRIALEELGLAYEAIRVDRAAGEHRSPGYLGLNPQGLIPVLEDGDLVLFETGAILLHLADRTGRLGPDGPPRRCSGRLPEVISSEASRATVRSASARCPR